MRQFIHPDGWLFVGVFALVSIILYGLSETLGWVGFILTAWCVYFFRMPDRVTPAHSDWIVSPSDGKVVLIEQVPPPVGLGMDDEASLWRVSVFLNVFDVHVNYIPFAGTIKNVLYHAGQFLNASLDKASDLNERNTILIELEDGRQMAVVQIAGLIARRIRCDVKNGDSVSRTDVFGLIRFGSRVDLYLPKGVEPLVSIGQRMIGGETLMARLPS